MNDVSDIIPKNSSWNSRTPINSATSLRQATFRDGGLSPPSWREDDRDELPDIIP